MSDKNTVVLELIARFENAVLTPGDRTVWNQIVHAGIQQINSRPGKLVSYSMVLASIHVAVENNPKLVNKHVFQPVMYPEPDLVESSIEKIRLAVDGAKKVLHRNQLYRLERISEVLKSITDDRDSAIQPGTFLRSCFLKYDSKTGPKVCVDDLFTYGVEHHDCPMFKANPNSGRSDCLLFGSYQSVAGNIKTKVLNKDNTDIYKP